MPDGCFKDLLFSAGPSATVGIQLIHRCDDSGNSRIGLSIMANIVIPRRGERLFNDKGEPTLRFANWMELVTGQTNETTDVVDEAASQSSFNSQLQQVQKELDGLPEFTMDTTGFTFDSTEITFDKVIA